jgi:hypothetical protein
MRIVFATKITAEETVGRSMTSDKTQVPELVERWATVITKLEKDLRR